MSKDIKRMIKCTASFQKELKWLEEMAAQGWFLKNIVAGIFFTFQKGEPRKMCYDMERFNLSKKPSLEEIRRKEMFREMAREMGWREVTHDEGLNYYFSKEYEEGGVNCLHNDEESRLRRARSFQSNLYQITKKYVFWSMIVLIVDILVRVSQIFLSQPYLNWYHWFALFYVVVCDGIALYSWRLGEKCFRELSMTREEWEESLNSSNRKTVRRLILTNRGLNRFLRKQAEEDWILTEMTPTRYYFEKGEGGSQVYTLDSKWLVNKRRQTLRQSKIKDGKDLIGMNNDWELESVREAEEKGWSFVCALENRSIIYRGEFGTVQPLNDARYDNSLRWISLVGEYGFYLFICGLTGGVIGFLMSYFR